MMIYASINIVVCYIFQRSFIEHLLPLISSSLMKGCRTKLEFRFHDGNNGENKMEKITILAGTVGR
jgi:hypothetical protein